MIKQKEHKNEIERDQIPLNSSAMLFALILGCFFISGLTGLTYEILWMRMIVKIIGSSPFAVSIVLTVFMAGLGLGSYLAGRTIDRIKEPLTLIRIYGILELAIGGYGLIFPLLLWVFKPLYAALYNHLFSYFLTYNLLTFIGCTLVLIIPVTFMGATLPVLSRFFVTSLSRVGTHVGRLYGLNTIGAAVGSLLCGFWLINWLGVWGTLSLAIIFNAAIGGACIFVSAKLPKRVATSKEPALTEEIPVTIRPPSTDNPVGSNALIIFAVSGFCAMAYEVIWTKLLGLIVGPTTYSFTIVLVTFITGLALGAMFFGWLGDRVKNTMLLLLFTQVAAALFALIFSQVMGNSQIFFAGLIFQFKDNFTSLYLVKAIVLFLFMFPPTFCLGATFPLVGKIYTTSLSHTGRSIGFAYAINSVGAVLGSFCAGFLLIPLMGKEHGLRFVILIQILTVLFISFRVFRKTERPMFQLAPVVACVCIGLGFISYYPHWDHNMFAKANNNRFDRAEEIKNAGWLNALFFGSELIAGDKQDELLFYGDGIGGFTTVVRQEINIFGRSNFVLSNSGKADASSAFDMHTQTLLAHFPLLFHPHPENVLIIGLASGITAGEVLNYPVKQLDIVEINEQVVIASNFFREWNYDVLSNPKTSLIIQDGRAHLALSDQKYDVISSEPSNPWMAGIAALFTQDVFELARNRLNDDGMFIQWIHSYQMDWPTFALVGRTFSHVFPNSLLVVTDPFGIGGDFLLVGFKGRNSLDRNIAARNLVYAQRSKNITLLNPDLFYGLIVNEDLKSVFGDGPINSDNWPRLEFSAPAQMYVMDPGIGHRLFSRMSFSNETEKIRANFSNVDTKLDFMAFAMSVATPNSPLKTVVNLDGATPAQKERFVGLFRTFCEKNPVTDFSFLKDEELKKRCTLIQIESVLAKMNSLPIWDKIMVSRLIGKLYAGIGMANDAARYFSNAW